MVEIENTFAEAFEAWYSRVLITAINKKWAEIAAREACGYATSLIGCDAEAGIDTFLSPKETPDGRYGCVIQIWSNTKEGVEKSLLNRIGQCVLTCPTTRVWNFTESEDKYDLGYRLKYYGDGYEKEKEFRGRKIIEIPIMMGEFIIEKEVGIAKGVAGGNFIILAESEEAALKAGELAVKKISEIRGVITPFPGGVCSAGSKIGSRRYKFMVASTNEIYCPTLSNIVENSKVKDTKAALEVVINGITRERVEEAMRKGIKECLHVEGVRRISAGNYGGKLGKIHIHLRNIKI